MTEKAKETRLQSRVLVLLAGATLLLTACSTSRTAATTTSSAGTRVATLPASAAARQSCSLLTINEAATVFGGPVAPLTFCNLVPPDSSEGLYLGTGPQHFSILLKLFWSLRAQSSYEATHAAPGTTGRTPSSPLPRSTTVSDIPAYWTTQPASTNGPANGPQILTLTTSKHGYVLSMATQNLSPSQVTQAMAIALGRI